METKIVVLLLLPIISLVLILAWSWLILTRQPSVKINLKGFGITISLDNTKRGKQGDESLKEK